MIEKRYGTLGGLTAPILVYADVTEADNAAGRVGAMLDEGNDNLVYRGTLNTVRDLITTFIEEKTGFERAMKPAVDSKGQPRKDAQGNPILTPVDNDGLYVKKALGAAGLEDFSQYQSEVDELCRNFKVKDAEGKEVIEPLAADIKARERTAPKVVKLAQKYKDSAKQIIDAGKVDAFNQKYGVKIGKTFTATGDSAKDQETLGYLVKEYAAWKEDQDKQAMLADLAA